jgi:hypothetical protein
LLLYVPVAATTGTFLQLGGSRKRSALMPAVPLLGGLIASVIGIVKGAVFGIAPQLAAFLGGLPGGTH